MSRISALCSTSMSLVFLTVLSSPLYHYQSIHIYEESHCQFDAPWTTLIAFKDVETRKRWYRSPAAVELDLSRRILPTKDGKTSLRYFDGATMKSYQMPARAFEDQYCHQQDKPEECADKVRFGGDDKVSVSSAYNPLFERRFADAKPKQVSVL
jgi:hypothetical protein